METRIYKVLVVDDSPFMRKIISGIIESDPRFKVVGTAFNGQMALHRIKELAPDVITLDFEMPVMDGLETLKALKDVAPIPVIMVSSHTKRGAEVTIQSLELGAFDFVQKPDDAEGITVEHVKNELLAKLLAAAKSKKPQILPVKENLETLRERLKRRPIFPRKEVKDKIVVIGSSTGGPPALKTVLSALPKDFPAKILIVQHMPPKFTETFAQRLDSLCEISVAEAKDWDIPAPGKALLAPGNYHMTLDNNGKIRLNQEPAICGLRPAADITFKSVSQEYNSDVICVVLTGMGHDGTEGVKFARENGAYCIAEHESTCVVYGMPRSVVEAGQADAIVPLHDIPEKLMKVLYE